MEPLEYDITWKGTLDLEAVDDGGLQILATFDEPNINYICQDLAGLFGKADQLKNAVANTIKDTKNTKNDLVRDLANKQGLILPAAGIFFFKNPMLSWRGDLICSVA
ncbi:hypothetical protein SLS60_008098 [Paraconiothyrium brasiliense]|uniref:Uncharacterized protein n=1 Tax=Paraconiothyrium brasiliense TaxID=300254 RepID=A0ABR3R3W2_9PLEO